MASSSNNVSIDPVNVLWQAEGLYQFDVSALSDPDGVYFTLDSSDGDLYYVWFDLDAGSTDPAPAGRTAIEVSVTTGDSASVIAGLMQAAIDGVADFSATVSGSLVDVKQAAVGRPASDPVDVDSGVVITVCREGVNLDLGWLEGDVELNMAPSNFILTSHQSGVTPRAALYQGLETAEVATVLQETVNSKLKEIYGIYGSRGFVPASGTEVFGIGTAGQGDNLLVKAGRLILRPVNAVNNLTDTTLMMAVPVPDTLLFSGENPKTLSVTWQGFVDDTKDTRVNILTFGDASQAGLDI